MIAGTLEIQLLANMARLQTDMDKAKSVVSNAASAMTKILGTIGVGVSIAGITSMIKSVVDTGDKLNDLRKITGLTVNELGGLDKQAKLNGTNLDSVAKAIGIMSKNMYAGADAFNALGISTKDSSGALRNANQVLLDVADKFSRMQDGAQKSALANQLFGKSGRDLIPMLNEGRAALEDAAKAHEKYSGWTNKSAEQSDKLNDELTILDGRISGIKTRFVSDLLPTLLNISAGFFNATENVNKFSFSTSILSPVLKGLAIAGYTVFDTFNGVARSLGAAVAQMVAMGQFDFNKVIEIESELNRLNAESRDSYDKFVTSVMDGDKAVTQLTETQKDYLKIEALVPDAVDKTTKALKAKNVVSDAQQLALLRQNETTKNTIELANKVESITQGVATEQEKYNQTLEELDRLKPYLSIETYNRALEKAQKELKGTEVQTRTTTDEVSQLWMQAGRNIQSTLANSIFNFFDDGLKGMLNNVISTVGRIASEFAALKIAQSVGLAGIFGGASGSALAGGGSGGSILGSAMSLGSNALSFLGGGGKLLGSAASALGFTSFGAGASGAATAGVFGAGGASYLGGAGTALGAGAEFGTAATLGASMASAMAIAGPLIAVDIAGRLLAGDKKLGGAEMIPVIGGVLAALFGRGPYKFRQQSLQGDISSEGFDGNIANVFRSKGGLFSKNKHKTVIEQLSADQQLAFDTAITGFYDSAHSFAENLGLPTKLVDEYTTEIQIKSNKGGKLKEEAITAMLQNIGDGLATNVLPNIAEFARSGENATTTLARLSSEFTTLTASAGLLFDKSAEWSKNFVQQFGIGARSGFLEMAGGEQALAGMVSGFAQNFLTEDQRMKPVIASLLSERDKLGLSGINTRSQYTNAVQSGKMNPEQLIFLLRNQDAINNVFVYLEKFNAAVAETAIVAGNSATAILSVARNVNDTEQGQRINNSISEAAQAIAELESIAAQLAGTVNSINPLSVDQARAIIASGNPYDPNLQNALSTLSSMGTSGFSSREDFARSQGQNVTAVNSLQSSVSSMTMSKQAEMAQYEFEKASLQAALNGASSAYNSIAQFDTGSSYVPKTGMAVIHEGERVINDDQNKDIVSLLSSIAAEVKKTSDTLVRVTRNGDAMVTA